ncbi:alpha/beta fold hydrolase [Leptolyngbya sp. FACHB-541]|uniref:alpha/beta fold hydrolase n=1 Tax=Leptolyngbya sp. FACHB-541 TaxID=2692810 RepID=UPI001F557EFE|nr:alpha/beta fold hydrolase [Leptolyngbya sp. FACHB-541]
MAPAKTYLIMPIKPLVQPWQAQMGFQRDWVWRGWQTRYTYIRAAKTADPTAPPLLFLHGFGSAIAQWHSNLVSLSQSHTIYALDMLGFGASEKAAAPYRVDLWVDQVYDFWRTLIGQPVVLVGHSLGALVSLTAAVAHPEMIRGLVLITLPAARQETLPEWLQPIVNTLEGAFSSPLLIRPLFNLIRRPNVLRSILRLAYTNPENVTEDAVASFVAPALDRGAAQAFCRLSQARTKTNFSPQTKLLLPQLQAPTLMLWGEQDKIIPLAWGRQLPALNPLLQMVEIPETGHFLYEERSQQVNEEILTWSRQFSKTVP